MKEINLSLVAFYGDKPTELFDLITKLQTHLANHSLLVNKFIPYQIEQVHGTIIGCEGWKTDSGIVDRWFKDRRKETKYINLSGLLNYLQQIDLSLTVRFGGYNPQTNYNFLSRGQHLSDRSFQLQAADSNTIPVLIGWSWQNNTVTLAIDELRRNFQQFGLLHKYHNASDSVDNDFYLRLGTIGTKLSTSEIDLISTDVRDLLSTFTVSIPLSLNNLAFAKYQDLQLTPETTKVVPVASITASQLKQLYFL
ncbi:MAG: hypothetical protein AAFO95_19725 [Cyanobacteria bacterium J06600_6]